MSIRRIAALALGLLLFPVERAAHAQAAASLVPATLNIFLDCSFFCDTDFIHTEINYVNWVRDRTVSDVHVLVTGQSTGGGGTEFTLAFIGLRSLGATADTLRFVAPQQNTSDLTRRSMTRIIKLGLARFLARTEIADRLNLTLAPAPASATGAPAVSKQTNDPWNFWVLTISGSGNTNGEQQSRFSSISGGLSARRTTNAWKINLSARESYNESKFTFDLSDGGKRTTTSIRRSLTFSELAVKSLGPKLSAGLVSAVGSSTFENKKFYYRMTPAVEYDVYPYSESTRRMLTIQYSAGIEGNRYNEQTIYFKTDEVNPLHSLSLNLSQTQPWGSVNLGLSASQFLHDTRKNAASVFASTNVRILKGLSFSLSGNFSSIHDQLYLPRRGATDEEVLLRQRSLQTNYSYFAFASINYTFGSIFNNVVNPRFGGGGQSFFFF